MTPPPYVDDRRDGGGGGGACKTCINITKWMPVLFICVVISWSYYAFVIQLCFMAMRQLWAQILSLIIYHIALVLFLWAYWQTIFTKSSRVPRKFRIPPSKGVFLNISVIVSFKWRAFRIIIKCNWWNSRHNGACRKCTKRCRGDRSFGRVRENATTASSDKSTH